MLLFFMVIGGLVGFYLQKSLHTFRLKQVLEWAGETIGNNKKEIAFVDDWDPENHEMRQYRVLKSSDDAESEEEFFKECPNGLVRLVKLDRKRRAKYGIEEIDPLNAFDLTLSEDGEEEALEMTRPFRLWQWFLQQWPTQNSMVEMDVETLAAMQLFQTTQLKPVPTALPENTSQACQDRPSQRMRRLDFQQSELTGMTLR